MHRITHIELKKILLSWKVLHWRRGQPGRLISAVPAVLKIEIVGLIDHASKYILLKFRGRCISFSFNFYMDPPSLPLDIKHSYYAQTLHVFLFQNVFEENQLILCFAEGQPSMWNSNTREKPTNMCRRPTLLPPRLWKQKEIKRNLIIICILHFLNAKKVFNYSDYQWAGYFSSKLFFHTTS